MSCKLGCCESLRKTKIMIEQKLAELENNADTESDFYQFLQKLVLLV